MGKEDGEVLVPPRRDVASGIAVGIGIFFFYNLRHAARKVGGIPSLVQDRLPQPDGGMVTVAAHHVSDVVVDALGKHRLVAPKLPAGRIDDDKETQFVARIHKSGILRIMGVSDDAQTRVAQFLGVAPMQAVGQGVAYHGKVLVAIGTDERIRVGLAVQPKAVLPTELDAADADASPIAVHRIAVFVLHIDVQVIKVGRIGRPQMRLLHRHRAGHLPRLAPAYGQAALCRGHRTALAIAKLAHHPTGKGPIRKVAHMHVHPDLRRSVGYVTERYKQAAARHLVLAIGVGDEDAVVHHQPAVAVDASAVSKIQIGLRLSGRIGGVVPIVRPDGNDVFFAPLQPGRHIGNDGQVAAKVLLHQLPIDPHPRLAHDGLEVQEELAALPTCIGGETFAIPSLALIVHAATGFGGQQLQTIGQGHGRPSAVVKVRSLGPVRRTLVEAPVGIQVKYFAPGFRKRIEAGRRKLRPVVRPRGEGKTLPTQDCAKQP